MKVIKDFGLAGIYIFSVIIAIFLGTSLVHKEIEKRTLYVIFSKPVSVIEFIIGKFLGLLSSVVLTIFLMSVIQLTVIFIKGGGIDAISLWAILLLIFEMSIFISLTILFSTFSAPLAGTIYSIIVLYIGHSMTIFKQSAAKSSSILRYLTDLVYYIFPNLEKFNLRNNIVHNMVPSSGEIIYPILYSLTYCAVLLWLATLALKKQDL